MIVLRMAGKILLLPVWLLLATAHLLVWERFALLAVASGILLFFLWIGVFMEVILESAQHKIGELIIK